MNRNKVIGSLAFGSIGLGLENLDDWKKARSAAIALSKS